MTNKGLHDTAKSRAKSEQVEEQVRMVD